MASAIIKFNNKTLSATQPDPTKRFTYFKDSNEKGLILCVTSKGFKSFQVYMKVSGKPQRITLGRFNPDIADSVEIPRGIDHNEFMANSPELNYRMAKELALRVKLDLKSGIRPQDIKKAKRGQMTLGELFQEYHDNHLVPNGVIKIDEIKRNYERLLGEIPNEPRKKHGAKRVKAAGSVNWHKTPADKITKQDVIELYTNLTAKCSKGAAVDAVKLLKAMYNWAINAGLNFVNPATSVNKHTYSDRERFLSTDEMPRFFAAVAAEKSQSIRDYVMLSLLTGARKKNVTSMRWEDINFERATWRIGRTKNGDPVTLPLTPEAIDILKNRKPTIQQGFVFPAKSKSGHMVAPRRGWHRILDTDELTQLAQRINDAGGDFEWPIERDKPNGFKANNIETLSQSLERARNVAKEMKIDTSGTRIHDLRIHDLRRTLGSWQAAMGSSLVIIGKSLGHRDLASTQIYSRLHLDPVRASVETATRAMLETMKVQDDESK